MSLTIAVLGVCLSAATFFIGRVSGAKTDGREMGEIKTLLNCIQTGITEIKGSVSNTDTRVDNIEKHLAAVDASARSAHKRIDEIVHKG